MKRISLLFAFVFLIFSTSTALAAGALSGFNSIISNQPAQKPKNIHDALNVYYKTRNFKALLSVYVKHPNQASKLTTNHSILHLIANSRKKDDTETAKIIYIAFKYNKHLKPNYQGTVIVNPEYKKRCYFAATSIHWVTPIFMSAINNLKTVYKVLLIYKANPNITSIIYHDKLISHNMFATSCESVQYKNTLSAGEAKINMRLTHEIELNYNGSTDYKGVGHVRNIFNAPFTWNFNN